MIILGLKYVFVCWNKWEVCLKLLYKDITDLPPYRPVKIHTFFYCLPDFIPTFINLFLWCFCFPSKQPVVHACYLSVLNECYLFVYHYRHVAAKLSVTVHAAVRGTVVPAARPASVTRQPVWTAKVVIHMIQTRAQNRWVVLIIYLSIKMSNDNNW